MFCSNCGAEASGNFCSKCGAPLGAAGQPADATSSADWTGETRYEKLIAHPEVRARISRHAAMAQKGMSGDEFLAFADKVMPLGVSLEKMGQAVQPIFAQLGIRTGKQVSETLASPPGAVIVAALCSLARRGQMLEQVKQHEHGCVLEARLPSDLWSFEGALYVSIARAEGGTLVECATVIKGQVFDWGKSKRVLEALLDDLRSTPA